MNPQGDDLDDEEMSFLGDDVTTQPHQEPIPMEHKDYEFRRRHHELDGIDLLLEFLQTTKRFKKRFLNTRFDKIFVLSSAARCIREYKLTNNVFVEVLCQLLFHSDEMQRGLIGLMNKHGGDMSRDELFQCFKVPNSAAESLEEVRTSVKKAARKKARRKYKMAMKEKEAKKAANATGKSEQNKEKTLEKSDKTKEKTVEKIVPGDFSKSEEDHTTNPTSHDSENKESPLVNDKQSENNEQSTSAKVEPSETIHVKAEPSETIHVEVEEKQRLTRSHKRNHQEKVEVRRSKRCRKYTYKIAENFTKQE